MATRAPATNHPASSSGQLFLMPLLRAIGFKGETTRIKLVRHQDHRFDIARLMAAGQLEIYQGNQSKRIFHACDSILTFSADGGRRSEFVGLYHLRSETRDARRSYPSRYLYRNSRPGPYWYEMEKDNCMKPMEGRLVIDWGGATRAWHQWMSEANDKPVVEMKASGRQQPFPGYDDIVLSFVELRKIISHRSANPDWWHALSKVSGVYLIQDTVSGVQYVGSAYGVDGIWKRWLGYVTTNHGGNARIRELCRLHPGRQESFCFSILETMPLSSDKEKVVRSETIWKKKLGSRAHGLNAN